MLHTSQQKDLSPILSNNIIFLKPDTLLAWKTYQITANIFTATKETYLKPLYKCYIYRKLNKALVNTILTSVTYCWRLRGWKFYQQVQFTVSHIWWNRNTPHHLSSRDSTGTTATPTHMHFLFLFETKKKLGIKLDLCVQNDEITGFAEANKTLKKQ